MTGTAHALWPELPYAAWHDTAATLHLWTQIVGKVRLARTPWLNHSWHVPFYVTARGLSTSLIPDGSRAFDIEFNFAAHRLEIQVSDGARREIALRPRSVAEFHAEVLAALAALDIAVEIDDFPCEIPGATRFASDRAHAAYDAGYANRFWRVLVQTERVFALFRTSYLGKCSPVHFFWGSFDLAVTRFSGRRAPLYGGTTPGVARAVMQEAYSHEVSSAGFWPGGSGADDASYYSYAYPTPEAFREQAVRPEGAYFSEDLGQFLLPYDVVRRAPNPDAALLAFLESTYQAAAESAGWDRTALECPRGIPGIPRPATTGR